MMRAAVLDDALSCPAAVCWPQMSAAAFIKGLLDLEGSSLTPILVSLVTKNASMLDAFGKVRALMSCRLQLGALSHGR